MDNVNASTVEIRESIGEMVISSDTVKSGSQMAESFVMKEKYYTWKEVNSMSKSYIDIIKDMRRRLRELDEENENLKDCLGMYENKAKARASGWGGMFEFGYPTSYGIRLCSIHAEIAESCSRCHKSYFM